MKNVNFKLPLSFSLLEIVLGIMACASLLLVLIPQDWAQKTLVIDPSQYQATIDADEKSNGNSVVKWIDHDRQIWSCTIGNAFSNPFCNITLTTINEQGQGLDLRDYRELTVYGHYRGNSDHIRIYLRNRNPDYYNIADHTTTKYNMVEIPVDDLENGFTFRMKDFGVADWWITEKNIPLHLSHPDFQDIIYIEIQTGSLVRSGTHELQLKKIELVGSYLASENLYKSMVVAWSVTIIALLLFRVIQLKLALARNQHSHKELMAINTLLNVQNKQFEDLAKTDPLTGLLNRMGIRDSLYDGLQRWKNKRVPFSFILVDLDHFKKINDTYGHDKGDEILKSAATLLKNNVRQTDYLARWGGEEFILVCPNTDLKQAHAIAENLRRKLESATVDEHINLTASFGVASMNQPDLDALFNAADQALYDAKRDGRNRVVCTA